MGGIVYCCGSPAMQMDSTLLRAFIDEAFGFGMREIHGGLS
ncbi:hypothetical protein RAS1_02440 [Phycisphaerae bacterium RAS1]|nr:hypothetical protein RAS1_02440 [Phycisphaerae bacterium RAS1]